MRSIVTGGLCYLLLASVSFGAANAEFAEAAPSEAGPVRVDGLIWGNTGSSGGPNPLASPAEVTLSAMKELGAAGGPLSTWLWGAGGLALGAAAAAAILRHKRNRKLRLQSLYEVADTADEVTRTLGPLLGRRTPRVLPINPYLDPSGPRKLARQIDNAAEASLEFGRVLGLVYFDLGDPPEDEDAQALLDWASEVSKFVAELKGCLRPTDHVAFLNDREIVACIALLSGMTDLVGIGERLRRVGQASRAFATAFARQPGLAIFPLCGYRGEELIAHARADFSRRESPVIAYLPLARSKRNAEVASLQAPWTIERSEATICSMKRVNVRTFTGNAS